LGNKFTIVAALREKMFWFGLLKISTSDFIAWNLCCDSQHGNAAAVAIVEAVD